MRAILLLSLCLSGCSLLKGVGMTPLKDVPPQLETASNYYGLNERADRSELKDLLGVDPVYTEWCAAFVNSVLDEAGIEPTESLLARSYETWGIAASDPKPGDIMVFKRGKQQWQGHVGFFVTEVWWNNKHYWVVLGGNQDQSVSYKLYPVDTPKLLAIRTVREPTVTMSTMNWKQEGVPLLLEDR